MTDIKKEILCSDSVKIYDVILGPHITEKATMAAENHQYIFKVSSSAAKPNIKIAIEKLFKVKVKAIQTINIKGKSKKFRGRIGKRNDVKKAIIRLHDGQTIDMTAGGL